MFKKKSLGQNFLTSAHYLALIADATEIAAGDTVLEIGPGEGALTRELLARGARVVAVEKDRRLIPVLGEIFKKEIEEKRFELIEADALEFDPSTLGPYKLVANIPYYITGALIEKFLSHASQPASAVLLVQKEVAERIARDEKESILSLSVKAFGEPRYIKTVPAGAFSPPPSVDSAILSIKHISRNNFANAEQEKLFFDFLHAGFAHKRKLLRRNLEAAAGEQAAALLERADIPQDARAEDVKLEQWLGMSRSYLI
jgi:16S rRNA (adenine1518-N6/adenine1519-N6)-dimethyltransferase